MLFLHEKTKELQKLPEKSEKLTKQILQKSAEELIGNNYNKIVHNTTKLLFGKDTAGMLDISHGTDMNDTSYLRDAIYLKNKNSPHIESSRKYLTKKLSSQFADYGFNINAIPGYFFKSNSEPVQRIINSSDFQKILKNNRSNILRNKNFSGQFANNGYNYKSNLHNAFGKVDFRNPYFDKEGNLHIKMYDTYDFNKTEKSILVKAGANQMEKGNLKPFFTIHDIIIKKEVWGNILLP